MASAAVQQRSGHTTSFEPLIPVQHPSSTITTTTGSSSSYIPHDVHTSLNYYKEPADGSAPHPSIVGKPETYDRPSDPVDVVVRDVRGKEAEFSLDGQGFQFVKHESEEKKFVDEEKIKEQYYPEVEQLLKDATGATRIHIFDHTIRRASPSTASNASNLRGPVNRVHIDQSYTAARARIPSHLPSDAERLLRVRHQIINVWRPIKKILKDPLAVADAHSVPEADLVPIGLWYPKPDGPEGEYLRKGETLGVRGGREREGGEGGEGHRWYYLHGQDVDEVLLIKCFDSKVDGRARRVPHTAFVSAEHEDEAPRESIEVRCLVFYEDQSAE